MRSYLALLILLGLLGPAWGQSLPGAIVLGGAKPTPAAVEQAKAVLAAAEDRELVWSVGEFDLIVRGPQAAGVVTFDSTDDTILALEEIPAGVILWMNDVRAGQKERVLHKFSAQKESYWVARAVKEGRCTIKVWGNGEGGNPPRIIARLDVRVGKPKPPDPGPNPPPGPAPIVEKGLRVLIVRETKDLTPQQAITINAQEVHDYLSAKCVKVNGQPEWRAFDPNQDVSRASKVWQDAMKIERKSLPWVIISDGEKGASEPLPATVEDFLKLLKTYGGN
jgi:hypothetical protein